MPWLRVVSMPVTFAQFYDCGVAFWLGKDLLSTAAVADLQDLVRPIVGSKGTEGDQGDLTAKPLAPLDRSTTGWKGRQEGKR